MEKPNKMKQLEDILFPQKLPTIESIKALYPTRPLPPDAMVTRFAPSPTGFLHIGGVYMGLISERFGHQSGGVYFVRMEDTDQKRKVAEAEDIINNGLEYFNLRPDEGPTTTGEQGAYGPYHQSRRSHLYNAFLKELVKQGRVYPCFCTEEELDSIRKLQTETSVRPGYYGVWAKWRDADPAEVLRRLVAGEPYVLRFKSNGDPNSRVLVKDLIKGDIELPANDMDIVVMKADGLPTYHFAHAVDDHLMGTTHVIRADEWVASTPLHFELYDTLGFPRLQYGHIAPINKIDGDGSRRKLSKRKDPEANVEYYQAKGYPNTGVLEYLMNLANSGFEDWRKTNPDQPYTQCPLTFAKLSQSTGPLFDEVKLQDISKNIIAGMTTETFFNETLMWARKYDQDYADMLQSNPNYWKVVFNIERGNSKRKDVSSWSEVRPFYKYFESDKFSRPNWEDFQTPLTRDEITFILKTAADALRQSPDADAFMSTMRSIAKQLGLAENIKEFKASKGALRGHVGLVTQVLRYALTGSVNSPDLHQIITALGSDEVERRLA
jgi:glutamyl-tRNA synthetase